MLVLKLPLAKDSLPDESGVLHVIVETVNVGVALVME